MFTTFHHFCLDFSPHWPVLVGATLLSSGWSQRLCLLLVWLTALISAVTSPVIQGKDLHRLKQAVVLLAPLLIELTVAKVITKD